MDKFFSVCQIRTDTDKHGERAMFFFRSEQDAIAHADALNEQYHADIDYVFRYIVRAEVFTNHPLASVAKRR